MVDRPHVLKVELGELETQFLLCSLFVRLESEFQMTSLAFDLSHDSCNDAVRWELFGSREFEWFYLHDGTGHHLESLKRLE